MPILSKQQLLQENNTNFPNNNDQLITPALLRQFNTDMIDSMQLTQSMAGYAVLSGSNSFIGNQNILGDLSIVGTLTATTIHTITESASVIYSSGSNQLGDELTDTQILSGSVKIVGNLTVNGLPVFTGSVTVDTGSLLTTASFNAYTQSNNQRVSSLEANTASVNTSISALNSFTQSQQALNATFATTGSNTFKGNQIIDKANVLYTNGIYWNDTTPGYTNLEIINQAGGNLDFASLNGGRMRIVNTPLILTGSALTSSNDISTSANIYAANLTGSAVNTGSLVTTASFNAYTQSNDTIVSSLVVTTNAQQILINNLNAASASLFTSASNALVTASFSGNTLTFRKGDNSTFGITIPDVSGSDISALNAFTASQLQINSGYNTFTQSADQRLDSIEAQSGSWVTSAITASSIVTASVNNDDITFTKGDGTQFTIQVATGSFALSASYAETASLAINAKDIIVNVKNSTGAQLNKGTVVRIIGAVGDNPLIATASWEDDNNSANTLGFVAENIPNDSFGTVMTQGTLLAINTDPTLGYAPGQLLYLSSSGQYTNVKPPAPYHEVRLGQVLRAQQNNGSVYVLIQNGYELEELHDVSINTGSLVNNDLLAYNSSNSQWTNKTVTEVGATTTASFNAYTSSTNNRLNSLEANSASVNTSISALNSFSASQLIVDNGFNEAINNLNQATASLLESASLALVTASFDNGTRNLTFTKGDTSTFSVNIPDVSGSTFDTGSFATTGSNSFNGNQIVTGSVTVTDKLRVNGGINIYTASVNGIYISDNPNWNPTSLGRIPGEAHLVIGKFALENFTHGDVNTAIGWNALKALQSGSVNMAIGPFAGRNLLGGDSNFLLGENAGINMKTGSYNFILGSSGGNNFVSGDYNTIIGTNTQGAMATGSGCLLIGGQNAADRLQNNVDNQVSIIYGTDLSPRKLLYKSGSEASNLYLYGGLEVQNTLTASLQEGYVWVGDASGRTTTVATSSFGGGATINTGSFLTTGSAFGTQNVFGTLQFNVSESISQTGIALFNTGSDASGSMEFGVTGPGNPFIRLKRRTWFQIGPRDEIYYPEFTSSFDNGIYVGPYFGNGKIGLLATSGSLGLFGGNPTANRLLTNIQTTPGLANTSTNLVFVSNTGTTTTIVSGSNNIWTNPINVTPGFNRYVGGNGNIITAGVPQLTGSAAFPVSMNNNITSTGVLLRLPVSSSAYTINSNLLLATGTNGVQLGPSAVNNFERAVSGLTMNNNVIAGILNTIAFKTPLSSSIAIANNLVGGNITLNMDSSSINFNGNLVQGGLTINNSYFPTTSTGAQIAANVNGGLYIGSSQTIFLSGSNTTLTGPPGRVINNVGMVGTNNVISASFNGDLAQVNSTVLLGQGLVAIGTNSRPTVPSAADWGSVFVGRWNSITGNSDLTGPTVFAVGTGTAEATRKTGFLIDSGSNTFVEGTLNVSGSTTMTGSLFIQSGSALPASTGSSILTWNAATGQVSQASFSTIVSASVSSAEFWSTTTQSGSAGVSGSLSFNNSGSFYNVSLVNGTQLQVVNAGVYNIQFSAQLETSAGADTIYVWFKKNGTNIGASASKAVLANNTAQIMTVNILDEAAANDYYEIAYQTLNGHATVLAEVASGNIPAIPSVIATIVQVR